MGFYKTGPGRDPFETTAVLITCNCGDLEHAVEFSYFPQEEWPELLFQFHLTTRRNVFERLWAAIRYVFGYRCRYGEWDTLSMDPGDARDLARFLTEYSEIATNQREKFHSQALAENDNADGLT
jgi:hypothetical protein